MITLREQRTVKRSVAEVYRYLSDFSTIQQWDPGVYRAIKVTAGPVAAGTEYALTLNSAGKRVPMVYQQLLLEPPSAISRQAKLVLQGRGSGFTALDEINLIPTSKGGCLIDYRADLNFDKPALIIKVLRLWLKRVGKQALDGLEIALTAAMPKPLGRAQRLAYKAVFPVALACTEKGYWAMPNKGLSERMDGKTVVVSGASAGLGLAAACEMARLGASVALVGRGQEKMSAAQAAVMDFAGVAAEQVPLFFTDFLDSEQVHAVSKQLVERLGSVDVLLNNAGALFDQHQLSPQGHERAWAVNFLSHVELTEALVPHLPVGARVINVVSGGMYLQGLNPADWNFGQEAYDGAKAYARAKRALMVCTQQWAEQYPQLEFQAMHPGWAGTPGVEKSLPGFYRKLNKRLRDAQMGADTMVWLASRGVALPSGKLWFDRQAVPTDILPFTKVSQSQKQALFEHLAALANDE